MNEVKSATPGSAPTTSTSRTFFAAPAKPVAIFNSSKTLTVQTLKFLIHSFSNRYHHLYSLRLQALRSRVESSVKSKYGPNVRILKLADLDNLGDNKKVVVIGTLMKNQIHKPSILKEYAEENAKSLENPPEEKREVFTDDSDDLVLEDEVQRAKLHFGQDQDFHVGQFVNGVVVGVYGHLIPLDDQDGGGRFKVIDIIYPETAPQVEKPLAAEDRYVLFISGIELSGPNPNAGLGKVFYILAIFGYINLVFRCSRAGDIVDCR